MRVDFVEDSRGEMDLSGFKDNNLFQNIKVLGN